MNIVGIRFKRVSKIYYFDPAGVELNINEQVVVETARGLELGQVVIAPKQVLTNESPEPLKPVIRKAGPDDIKQVKDLETKEKEAMVEGTKLVERLNLQMKLISSDYNLDGSRVTVYFSAEERVDFRELVREMAGKLHTRVELRQVGPRDEAKLIGGYGRCGRQLCCGSFLSELTPVSMKMAKDQGLPLNPMKISGCCGRLMCCLSYECQQYRDMRKNLPKEGQRVITPSGPGKVIGVNPLSETILVQLDESQATIELAASDIKLDSKPPELEVKDVITSEESPSIDNVDS
jgi:cell fate regulator YaaT (PSP1 superfamily)